MLVGLQHGRPRLHVREEAAADEEAVLGERPELRLFHDLVEERELARGAATGSHERCVLHSSKHSLNGYLWLSAVNMHNLRASKTVGVTSYLTTINALNRAPFAVELVWLFVIFI